MAAVSQACRPNCCPGGSAAVGLRKTAFTLIELLVVVAIISLLAALLLPALSRAKEQGNSAVCKSNLHQMGIALTSYTGDFYVFPLLSYGAPGAPVLGGRLICWSDALKPYSHAAWSSNLFAGIADSTSRLYLCPSFAQAVGSIPGWPSDWGDGWQAFGPYGYNSQGMGLGSLGLGAPGTMIPTKASDVVCPSQMIAVGDANWTPTPLSYIPVGLIGLYDLVYFDGAIQIYSVNTPAIRPEVLAKDRGRHESGGRNILFCDGHVEFLGWPQLFDPKSDTVLSLWNTDHRPHRDLLLPGL